jgi:hypothetical protein
LKNAVAYYNAGVAAVNSKVVGSTPGHRTKRLKNVKSLKKRQKFKKNVKSLKKRQKFIRFFYKYIQRIFAGMRYLHRQRPVAERELVFIFMRSPEVSGPRPSASARAPPRTVRPLPATPRLIKEQIKSLKRLFACSLHSLFGLFVSLCVFVYLFVRHPGRQTS